MSFQCPRCHARIPLADINVAADSALCRACESPMRYSELLDTVGTAELASNPPSGTWRTDDGRSLRIGASCRGWMALPLLGFNAFWNGIVGVFVFSAFKSGQYWILAIISLHAAVGAMMFCGLLLALAGRVEVTIHGDQANVFTGVGPVGVRRRFNPLAVRAVRHDRTQSGKSTREQIAIDAERTVKLGASLSDQRREWLMAALAQTLLSRPRSRSVR